MFHKYGKAIVIFFKSVIRDNKNFGLGEYSILLPLGRCTVVRQSWVLVSISSLLTLNKNREEVRILSMK